jgi:hypothetical protein
MLPNIIIFVYIAVSSNNSRLKLLVIHNCLLPLCHWLKQIPTSVRNFANIWANFQIGKDQYTVTSINAVSRPDKQCNEEFSGFSVVLFKINLEHVINGQEANNERGRHSKIQK